MSIGKVQINNLNLMQGEISAVENHLLFVGPGKGDKVGKLLTVNTDSDLSGVLAGADGLLAQVTAARDNGGQNWSASVMLYDAEGGGIASWSAAVDEAMELARVEGVALTEPLSAVSDVEAMQTKSERIMARYMRPVWFAGRAPAFDADSQSWEEYATAIKPLTANVAADACLVTPTIWGPEYGEMMWPGLNCSPRCSGGRHGCGKVWPWSAAVFSVLALLTILSACSSGSLGERAARPVLPSLTRATVNGVPGVWMDERDAGTLALWIEEVSP